MVSLKAMVKSTTRLIKVIFGNSHMQEHLYYHTTLI
jgi:hypothetical protein